MVWTRSRRSSLDRTRAPGWQSFRLPAFSRVWPTRSKRARGTRGRSVVASCGGGSASRCSRSGILHAARPPRGWAFRRGAWQSPFRPKLDEIRGGLHAGCGLGVPTEVRAGTRFAFHSAGISRSIGVNSAAGARSRLGLSASAPISPKTGRNARRRARGVCLCDAHGGPGLRVSAVVRSADLQAF
jgi:hypothetical protein